MNFTNIGTSIMNEMLLDQYQNSSNLKEYIGAFVGEMDTLLDNIYKVYHGRLLDNALGYQLEVIGEILGQPRGVVTPTGEVWFGFQGHPSSGAFGVAPFRGANTSTTSLETLSDTRYRRLLKCRAKSMYQNSLSIDDVYKIVYEMIGYVPSFIEINDETRDINIDINFATAEQPQVNNQEWYSFVNYDVGVIVYDPADNILYESLILNIGNQPSLDDGTNWKLVTDIDTFLLEYAAKWFMPMTCKATVRKSIQNS